MATKLFVNLPVKDLARSEDFFTGLGFEFFGMTEDMASVIISEHTQVMLLAEATFASYIRNGVADPNDRTEAILVLGLETTGQVDDLVDKAVASGAAAVGRDHRARPDIAHGPLPAQPTGSITHSASQWCPSRSVNPRW